MNNKWGYIDKQEISNDLKFDGASPFKEDLAAVKMNDKWGYIDKVGKIIIEPQLDGVDTFAMAYTCPNKEQIRLHR